MEPPHTNQASLIERWAEAPLTDLVVRLERLLSDTELRLRDALERCPEVLRQELEEIAAQVAEHHVRESSLLFPLVARGTTHAAWHLVRSIERDNRQDQASLALLLARARTVRGAGTELIAALESAERALVEHITLEHKVLFPRALREH